MDEGWLREPSVGLCLQKKTFKKQKNNYPRLPSNATPRSHREMLHLSSCLASKMGRPQPKPAWQTAEAWHRPLVLCAFQGGPLLPQVCALFRVPTFQVDFRGNQNQACLLFNIFRMLVSVCLIFSRFFSSPLLDSVVFFWGGWVGFPILTHTHRKKLGLSPKAYTVCPPANHYKSDFQ